MNFTKETARNGGTSKETYAIKLVMIGDPAVGKTSIVRRYLGRSFSESYDPTVGASFYFKDETYNFKGQKIKFKFTLWDIGGQPTFKDVRPLYYQGARAAIAVYDIARPETFHNIKNWIHEFHDSVDEERPFILVGNKIDLRSVIEEGVPESRGKALANEFTQKFPFEVRLIETSAKENKRLNEAFETIASTFYRYINKRK